VVTHTHEDLHFILVVSGEYVSAAGPRLAPDRPVLVYNPPGTTHRDHFENGRGSFFSMSLEPARARVALSGIALGDAPRYLERPEQQGLAVSLAGFCARQRAGLSLEALLLELLASMEQGAPPAARAMPRWLPRALELLYDRYDAQLNMAEVAAAAGVHPVYLARAFRRYFRCTPGAFTRFRRLEKAVGLLSRTASTLTEVALASGFADQSHLTHAFAHWLGVSPARYRALAGRTVARLQFDKTRSAQWSKLSEWAAVARHSARRGK
jgi:AraC family transcriptional regulator